VRRPDNAADGRFAAALRKTGREGGKMEKSVMEELHDAVLEYDEEKAERAAKKVLELKMDPYKAITESLTPAIQEMGNRFERGEAFLPELIMATDAMNAAVKILESEISKEKMEASRKGKIILATVKGDIHNIGKNIVGIMLRTSGYEVIDLGVDVEPSKFIEEAERTGAAVIMASALMTFTALNMKKIAEYLEMEGLRGKYKLVFGGGPLSEAWAKEMGADGYAPDALKAVELINRLTGH
jgi:corrinoid protein of di/trimethylamine methyltransferase